MSTAMQQDFEHRVHCLVLEFTNSNGQVYNETMRTLSYFYKAHWDAECARIFVYNMMKKNHKEMFGVMKTAAYEIAERAYNEFELGNFWE